MFHMKDPRVGTCHSATLSTTNIQRTGRELKTGPSRWDTGGYPTHSRPSPRWAITLN